MSKRGFERQVYDRAERSLALCAVICIGPRAGAYLYPGQNAPTNPVLFCATKDPDEILRQARKWHWHDIDLLAVVWCGSEADARAVKDEIDDLNDELSNPIRARWYDMTQDVAEEVIRTAADGAGVKVFNEATRTEKLRQEVRRCIEKRFRP